MNSKFSQQARLAGRLIHFLSRSGSRYRIHSPFLYDIVNTVIRNRQKAGCAHEIEALRKECRTSRELIFKTDYGKAGSEGKGIVYPVRLGKIARSSVTSPGHARRLARLAEKTGAGNILEIGTSLGFTTAYLACARPGARIITLEGCPELSRLASEHFKKLEIRNIEIITGRFEDTLQDALQKLKRVDLVYIDGNHRKEAMLNYYGQCREYAGNESVFVFDDIHSSREMEEAWELITGREEVRISLDLFFSGWVFFRKESSRQHFRLRYI